MPEQQTRRRAQQDRKEGKAPSTQAGEYVREEIEHIREGKHGARSAKQAIAIGLSKARRDGVAIPEKGKKAPTRAKRAAPATRKKTTRTSSKRSAAAEKALKQEPRSAGSHLALSRQAHAAAKKRPAAARSAAAKKAARTRAAEAR